MQLRIAIAAAAALFAGIAHADSNGYDPYGGWLKLAGTRTGFFHTQQIDGRWWLVTPDGHAFFSKGVDNVNYHPENASSPKAPADTNAWAAAAVRQLRDWNFNTAGAWSVSEVYSKGIVYAPVINMAASVQRDLWLKGGVVDYFSPEFRDAAARVAQRMCAPHAKDPWLLGYFTDNELRWGKDWRSEDSLLQSYLKMPETSPGFRKAAEFLKARGHAAASLTEDDKSEFLGLLAAEYARVTSEAIRRADPNHLVLGCRFAGYPGDTAVRAVGQYFDVISFHAYSATAPVDRLRQIARLAGKPTMITEFSFKAMDSGLPNTKGAAKPVATQQERADGFARYVEALAALPSCVGFHWFEYRDEPKEGRFDGENSNYGVVKIDFTPWDVLTARMTRVNAEMETRHAAAAEAAASAETIDLLPPEDFKGWTRIPIPPVDGLKPKMQWRVDAAQHVLICSGDGGHEWLRSNREFGDFILQVDWRFTPRAPEEKRYNSGIGVRISRYGEIWYQAQTGLSGGYLFGMNFLNGVLQSFNLSKQMKENRVKPAGEWNHYEVTARGDTLTLAVNGAVVSELTGCGLRRGSVAFEAEGFEVTFKNIKLQVLE
jgi:agarase